MVTEILDAVHNKSESIRIALEWLRAGMPVAFPTETVYGLGAGIFDLNAVEKIYRIKGRDTGNPLSAHISSVSDVEIICSEIKDDFYLLAQHFLPGPLSIVMRKKKEVSDLVTGGGDTISIRIPDNEVFRQLSKLFGSPIAATSANKSGRPSPIDANHVFDDLHGEIPVILDTGRCRYQIESTVVSLVGDEPVLIRPGAISQNKINDVLGKKIISLDKQLTIYNDTRSSLNRSKMKILCFDNAGSIESYYKANNQIKLLIMTRNPNFSESEYNIVRTNESTFFQDLREAEKSGIEILLVDKDEYVMSNEVLRHRLRI